MRGKAEQTIVMLEACRDRLTHLVDQAVADDQAGRMTGQRLEAYEDFAAETDASLWQLWMALQRLEDTAPDD